MTNREFYTAIMNDLSIDEALRDHAAEACATLDARNAARREKPSKAQLEALSRAEAVLAYLTEHKGEAFTRDQIAEALEISGAQVTAAVKAVKDGKVATDYSVVEGEIKVEKSKRKTYAIVEGD